MMFLMDHPGIENEKIGYLNQQMYCGRGLLTNRGKKANQKYVCHPAFGSKLNYKKHAQQKPIKNIS